MNRYWLFAGGDGDEAGGLDDFIDSFGSLQECLKAARRFYWWQILDTKTLKITDEDDAREWWDPTPPSWLR